jgi:hypothetical protein
VHATQQQCVQCRQLLAGAAVHASALPQWACGRMPLQPLCRDAHTPHRPWPSCGRCHRSCRQQQQQQQRATSCH